jgi:hypothetical protein
VFSRPIPTHAFIPARELFAAVTRSRRTFLVPITPELRRKPSAFLVARNVEARAGIAVLAARTPLRRSAVASRPIARSHFFRRRPQPATPEPHQGDVGMFRLQLLERGQQLLAVLRAERGRLAFQDDGPVDESRGHRLLRLHLPK